MTNYLESATYFQRMKQWHYQKSDPEESERHPDEAEPEHGTIDVHLPRVAQKEDGGLVRHQ